MFLLVEVKRCAERLGESGGEFSVGDIASGLVCVEFVLHVVCLDRHFSF